MGNFVVKKNLTWEAKILLLEHQKWFNSIKLVFLAVIIMTGGNTETLQWLEMPDIYMEF